MNQKRTFFLHNFAQNNSLRTKMFVIFFVLLILPSIFFIYYATQCVANILQEQTFSSTRKTFDETLVSVQSYIDKVAGVTEILVHDNLIYTMVSADSRDYPYIHQLEDSRTLSTSLNYLIKFSEVSNIRLYVKNDYLYSHENRNIFPLKQIADTSWYQDLLESPSGIWLTPLDFMSQTPDEQKLFSFVRLLYDPSNLTSPLAVLRVDLSQSLLERAFTRTATTKNAATLLISNDSKGNHVIFSTANEEARPLPKAIADTLNQAPQNEWSTISMSGIDYYSYRTILSPTGWQLATVIPYSDIYGVSTELRIEMIVVMLLVAAMAYAVAVYLSHHALKRIWQLSDTMQKVENGNVSVHFKNTNQDEIGQLITHFNNMMDRVRRLMDEKIQQGQEIKNLELKALQAQINPHFLYNTLDTINCLAIQKNVPEIVDVVSSLAAFYRISLSKGRDQIPIRDEVRHARAYLEIQNARFEDRINTIWEIDPEIESFSIVKTVLQPIIENAVIHGIYEKDNEAGTIIVRGWREDTDVYITVSDDGVGMSAEQVGNLFSQDAVSGITPTVGGYGLQNIYDRLHISYGVKYGLSCKSILGVGTVITIHIPVVNGDSN